MASHSQGIQALLAAEKKAADLVSDARKRMYRYISFFNLFLAEFGNIWTNVFEGNYCI